MASKSPSVIYIIKVDVRDKTGKVTEKNKIIYASTDNVKRDSFLKTNMIKIFQKYLMCSSVDLQWKNITDNKLKESILATGEYNASLL